MTGPNTTSNIERFPAHPTELGSLKILRALPRSRRRTVGPWCFLDRYGPLSFTSGIPMLVAPHPHMGLQTVSWLLEGEILHKDSLGSEALMHAGQLNLMTSGRGIAHSEETPEQNSGKLSGVQLWVALPDEHRNTSPVFDHYASLPKIDFGSMSLTVIAGEVNGQTSPARTFSELIGADLMFHRQNPVVLPLQPDYEHALFVLTGDVFIENQRLENDTLHYIGANRHQLDLAGTRDSRLLLIGGRPSTEPILMWWNFVARTPEEMAQAREEWVRHERFGEVQAYRGPRLTAPDLGKFAPANPVS